MLGTAHWLQHDLLVHCQYESGRGGWDTQLSNESLGPERLLDFITSIRKSMERFIVNRS